MFLDNTMMSLARIKSDTFLLVWNVASIVTFILPLLSFSVARLTSEGDEDQNNENQYQSNYDNPDYYDEYGVYIGPTHWWQFWKKNNNNGQDGDEDRDENFGAPWWYIWGEREGRDPEEEGQGAVLFVYLWTIMLFATLFYVGNSTRMAVSSLQTLRWILFGFANYCFVTIILLIGIEGAVETEGREIEETGFYGQRSVLLMVTCIFGFAQSLVFLSWTTKRIKHIAADKLVGENSDEYVNVEFTGQQSPTPGYKVTV